MAPFSQPEQVTVESVRFGAGRYRLEGELAYPDASPVGLVAIAGPHPMLGGSMHNNVVRGLGDGLAARGHVTLRFNYRGVGASEGPAVGLAQHAAFWQTSRAPDEPEWHIDLCAAVAFIRAAAPAGLPLALIGYSFGCTLLPLAIDTSDTPLILVAPTVGQHDFTVFEQLANPRLVIAPADDFAADRAATARWIARLRGPHQVEQPRRDGHFFRGHEDWLVATVGTFLGDAWGDRT